MLMLEILKIIQISMKNGITFKAAKLNSLIE